MKNNEEVLTLAEARVEKIFERYKDIQNQEEIFLAAINVDDLLNSLLDSENENSKQVVLIALDYISRFEERENTGSMVSVDIYHSNFSATKAKRFVLVGLAAAAIGASMGLMSKDLNRILSAIVGAEAAILLNVLASILTSNDEDSLEIDGLDCAVLHVLKFGGHYSVSEIAQRISASLEEKEVKSSIRKLKKLGLIKDGQWKYTYVVSDK